MPCVIFVLCVNFLSQGTRLTWVDGASFSLPQGFSALEFRDQSHTLIRFNHPKESTILLVFRTPLAKPPNLDEALLSGLLNIEVKMNQPINSHPNRFNIEGPEDWEGLAVFGENRLFETGNCWFIVITDVELLASYRRKIQEMKEHFSPPAPLSIRRQEFNLTWLIWGVILLVANLAALWVALYRFSRLGGSNPATGEV